MSSNLKSTINLNKRLIYLYLLGDRFIFVYQSKLCLLLEIWLSLMGRKFSSLTVILMEKIQREVITRLRPFLRKTYRFPVDLWRYVDLFLKKPTEIIFVLKAQGMGDLLNRSIG